MKALSLLPTQAAFSIGQAFGRYFPPILAVLLERGEEKMARDVAMELSEGTRGKIVTINTVAQYEAAERRLQAEQG